MACPEGGNVASGDLQGDARENASAGNRRLSSTSVSLWYEVQARGPRGVQVGFCLHKHHGCDLPRAETRKETPVTTPHVRTVGVYLPCRLHSTKQKKCTSLLVTYKTIRKGIGLTNSSIQPAQSLLLESPSLSQSCTSSTYSSTSPTSFHEYNVKLKKESPFRQLADEIRNAR